MLNALVIAHYKFKNDKGKEIDTTKLRVSLDSFGYIELCSELANDLDILSSCKVTLTYDPQYSKYKITDLKKN